MNKIFLSIITLLIILSCNNKSNHSSELVRLDFLYNDKSIDFSECDTIKIPIPLNINSKFYLDSICSHYSFIVLETNPESLIGEINKVIYTDTLIFIGDFNKQKSIFIFNHDGQFINKIKRYGRGPGEYRFRISNFFINDSLKRLTITDDDRSQIIETDYHGNLISITSPELFGRDIFKFPDDSLLYFYVGGRKNVKSNDQTDYMSYEYNLLVFDSNNNVSKSYFPINSDFGLNFGDFNNFESHNDKLFFKPRIDNRIFEINRSHLKCKYYINFESLVADSFYIIPRNEIRSFIGSKIDFPLINGFIINDAYCFLWGSYNKKMLQILYSKKSKNVYYGFDPVYSTFAGRIVGIQNQHLIMTMNASEITIFNPLKEKLGSSEQHIIETVDFYDNPIIILGKLRNF